VILTKFCKIIVPGEYFEEENNSTTFVAQGCLYFLFKDVLSENGFQCTKK
jgi:hypothetical protein